MRSPPNLLSMTQNDGVALPNALLGSGALSLGASVGHLSTQLAIGGMLTQFPAWGTDGLSLVAALGPNIILASFNLGEASLTASGG